VVVESGPERSLGITRTTIAGDDVVTSMASGPWLNGPAGIPLGGVLGVMVDDVLGLAIVRGRPAGWWTVSAEISLDLVGPVPADGSRIEASGRNVHSGPRGGISSGTVRDSSGRLVALCRQHGRWVTTVPAGPVAPEEVTGEAAAGEPLAEWVPPASLDALLGARVQLTEGGAVLSVPVTAGVANPLGNLHGGITLAACDLAAQAALHAAGGPAQTATIHVSYPRPMPLGSTPRFEARLVHCGRTLGIVAVTASLDGIKPCAVATITTGAPG
jgi:uncharacterized protein (TIGR00369 family)